MLRGVEEIARGLGLDPGPGRSGGTPRFVADLGALFETRLRRMAARGAREDAIAAAVIPDEPVTPETLAPAEMPGTPEEGETGGDPERGHEPGTDDEPQGSLGL